MIINTDYVKKAVGFVAGVSVSAVVKGVLRNNYTPEKKLQEAELFVACIAIGGLASAKVREYTDAKVDELFERFEKLPDPELTPEPETQE